MQINQLLNILREEPIYSFESFSDNFIELLETKIRNFSAS